MMGITNGYPYLTLDCRTAEATSASVLFLVDREQLEALKATSRNASDGVEFEGRQQAIKFSCHNKMLG
jgi:hypothetical protein